MNSTQFNQLVEDFQSVHDRNGEALNMHDLLIKEKDHVYSHNFRKEAAPSDVRSISKTVLTLALGRVMALAEEGQYPAIDEETYVYPMIEDITQVENKDNLEKLKQIQIKHLLTHTMGYEDVLLMRQDIVDMDPYTFVDYLVNYPIIHEPGEYYLYSNAGFYLLSVLLEEFLQEDLEAFLERELFDPLGIKEFHWEKYGNYLAGATLLFLYPEDLLKFGELFLKQGKVEGKQLISTEWLDKMLTIEIYTENLDKPTNAFRRYGYGYGTWLAKEPFYFAHGSDGQRLIMLPDREMILITLAELEDSRPMDELLNNVIEKT